jgi:hypothetical protein
MELIHFAGEHSGIISSVAIIASLLFTAVELRHLERAQRITNLLTITKHHREIWSQLFTQPNLGRVLEPNVDLTRQPVSNKEALFVKFLILHLQAIFKATKQKMLVSPEALDTDIHSFFSLPIPKTIWERSRPMQDADFVQFVESARTGSGNR